MNMNTLKNAFLFLLAGCMIASCSKGKYKKTKGGMPYQVFEGKDTQKIRVGDIIKLQLIQKIKDSVNYETVIPEYRKVTDETYPYDLSEIWAGLELGDSIVATQMIDTFIKRRPMDVPPQFKKGDKIVYYIKIIGVLSSDSLAQADYEQSIKNLLQTEVAQIEKHLADNKISAQKTPSGAYLEITTPGSEPAVDSGNYVSVNYTGSTWKGKKFDSNTDSAFGHVGPYSYTAGAGEMIKGFDEGVMLMNKGGKGKIYIPSMLGYAGQPPPQSQIKPFEMLVFDIEVVDVKPKRPDPPATRREAEKIDVPQPGN